MPSKRKTVSRKRKSTPRKKVSRKSVSRKRASRKRIARKSNFKRQTVRRYVRRRNPIVLQSPVAQIPQQNINLFKQEVPKYVEQIERQLATEKICIRRAVYEEQNGRTALYRYCIKKDAIPQTIYVDTGTVLGQGSYGVALAGHYMGNDVAVKLVPLDVKIPSNNCSENINWCRSLTQAEFQQEIDDSTKFGEADITPRVVYSNIVNLDSFSGPYQDVTKPLRIGVLVTINNGISLNQYMDDFNRQFRENEPKLREQYFTLLQRLYDQFHLRNRDIHGGNILIDRRTVQLKFIDIMPIDTDNFPEAAYAGRWHDMTIDYFN
jgi:hypothetical protein